MTDFQIIIPMSGTGQRFLKAGYKEPKPLLQIEGKYVIEHIVERFPGETKFIFICNQDHLKNTEMESILRKIAPSGKIVPIDGHKFGPVYAVSKVFNEVDPSIPCVVNYCDFSWRWQYHDFKKSVLDSGCDGCVVAYSGFHPHLLHGNLYASMRVNNGWMEEIREKHSFTESPMDCPQSSGTYYFRSGQIMEEYFKKLIDSGNSINGEYYVSMVYQLLVNAGKKVLHYNIPYMLQWGTPEDFEEYKYWSEYFLGRKYG